VTRYAGRRTLAGQGRSQAAPACLCVLCALRGDRRDGGLQWRHGLHLRQRHLTVHPRRPWGVWTAASAFHVHQRQEERRRTGADAQLQQGPPRGPRHRRRRQGDHRLRRHL